MISHLHPQNLRKRSAARQGGGSCQLPHNHNCSQLIPAKRQQIRRHMYRGLQASLVVAGGYTHSLPRRISCSAATHQSRLAPAPPSQSSTCRRAIATTGAHWHLHMTKWQCSSLSTTLPHASSASHARRNQLARINACGRAHHRDLDARAHSIAPSTEHQHKGATEARQALLRAAALSHLRGHARAQVRDRRDGRRPHDCLDGLSGALVTSAPQRQPRCPAAQRLGADSPPRRPAGLRCRGRPARTRGGPAPRVATGD